MNVRIRQWFTLLLGRPERGLSDSELKSLERNRVVVLTAMASAFNKGVTMLTVIAAISWTLPYLGETLTGAWLIIISLFAVLAFMDLGLGNAMTNYASNGLIAGPHTLQREVSVGIVLLLILGVVLTVCALLLIEYVSWQPLFKIPPTELAVVDTEISNALTLFASLFGLHLLTNGVIRTMVGMQQAHIVYLFQTFMGVLGLALLFFLTEVNSGLTTLLACIMAPQIVTGFVFLLKLIRTDVFNFRTGIINLPLHWRTFLSLGGSFFVLQICATLGWGADALIISSTLGTAAVTPFIICQRIFQFASQPVSILVTPLWPAYANAAAGGDKAYIRKMLLLSMACAAFVGGVLILAIIFLAPALIDLLVDDHVSVPLKLIAIYGGWVFLEILGATFAMFLNGMGIVRLQAVIALLYVAVSLPLKFWAVQHGGIESLILTGIVCYFALVVLPYTFFVLRNQSFRMFFSTKS
ncbi:hypothetical protein [Limnobacter parvus]|uniref:Polysaccharide biosynthesis protein n=1 Tax=Limnobacter parvus TaxID=2939690 RepID=A0ABT1XEB4_9BURK|nr:hypothetical protein [Limnobacter parvus]MCR2745239.1 hypothetical protein [Limnobacter parvus]